MPQISLTGHIDVPARARAGVAAALPAHIAATRAEPGCLTFEVTPDPGIAGRWQVRELFESRAAFEAHQARVATSPWGAAADPATRRYKIDEITA